MRRSLCLLVLGLVLAGCGANSYDREVAVRFDHAPGSTRPDPAQVEAVRQACPGTKTVILEPAGSTKKLSEALIPIRYDARKADDRQIALVLACIRKLPGVVAVGIGNESY